MLVRFSPRSESDLEEIGDYIALDSPPRAVAFIQKMRALCVRIGDTPYAYRARPELHAALHSVPMGRYIIFYRVTDEVFIARILHSARDSDAEDFASVDG